MSQSSKPVPGFPARLSALRLLDSVCRRGETLDQAMPSATGKLKNPSDKSLAHNIAANVLRWMTALDAMIDSTTKNPLAEDAKARMALRIALAQVLVLETPQHAAISTALPLVQGGPRRLVHGVFSTLMRGLEKGEVELPKYPAIPGETRARWMKHWGKEAPSAANKAWARQGNRLNVHCRIAAFMQASSHAAERRFCGRLILPGARRSRFIAA